jgi:hypothetical protein
MKDLQKIKEFFSKSLEENQPQFKKGDKVTYLGHPAEITAVNKEMTGETTYSVAYNKGQGRTKASNINLKSGAIKPLEEGNHNAEDFKPYVVKDRNNPNFLKVFIQYPTGTGFTTALGQRTLSGQDRDYGAAKAMKIGQAVATKLESQYNIEDIEVSDNDAGKVIVFAVSDDFIKMNTPSIDEAKDPDHLEKVRNIAKSLPHRYNIKPNMGMVKVTSRSKDELTSLKTELDKANLYSEMRPTLAGMFELTVLNSPVNEAKTAVDMAKKRLDQLGVKYEMSTTDKVRPFKVIYKPINKSDKFYDEFEDIVDLFNLKGFVKTSMSEAKEEDAVDTITMDIPLFLRMLEYSREDAQKDLDLHDVTEKANKLGKERGILSMDDYEEIVGAAEEIDEAVNLKASKLSSAEYQKAKKLKDFKSSDWKWNADEDLYTKVNEAELSEAYVPSNIKEFAKRKGVSSLVNKVAGWAEKVGKGIRGGTAIGYNYSTLILDMTYQGSEIRINTDDDTVTLYDEPVRSFNDFQRVYADGEGNNLEEGMGGQLDEPFFIQVSVRDARKAMDMFDDMYRNSNIKTYGSDVYAADTPEDIYDFFYDLNSSGIEILDANVEDDDNFYDSEYEKTLKETIKFIKENNPKATSEEVISELKEIKRLGTQLNEELCPAGKAYIKRRQAAGEKSSAYLSGRGVKVCKGQMSGKAKKKK